MIPMKAIPKIIRMQTGGGMMQAAFWLTLGAAEMVQLD
jgi:hypothetical protein